jgi:hypothetical protein
MSSTTKRGTPRIKNYPESRVYSTYKYRVSWSEGDNTQSRLFLSRKNVSDFCECHLNTIGRWLKSGNRQGKGKLEMYNLERVNIPAEVKRVAPEPVIIEEISSH